MSLFVLIFVFSETLAWFCVRSALGDSLFLDGCFVLQSPQGKWHSFSWVIIVLQISCHPDVPALPPTPLAPKFLSTLQEIVPHCIGSGKGTWLQKELSLVPAAPDPGILLTAHTCQVSQLHGTEENDATLNFNCQEQVEGGHCVHSRGGRRKSSSVGNTPWTSWEISFRVYMLRCWVNKTTACLIFCNVSKN